MGCTLVKEPYVPTGNGLTPDEDDLPGSDLESTEPPAEQDLVLVYYPEVTMNPYACTDFTNRALFSLLYQSLFTVDSNYNVFPMLCSRYTMSENMRTYSFYIEDATFSDGTPLTIEDVYASLEAARLSSNYKGRFLHVTNVYINEEGGITIKLDTPYENFPILMDIPIVKATEVNVERPLGTGPYFWEEATSGTRLRRRIDWWCDTEILITASSISLVVAESNTQIRDAFEFSDVGLVCANPGSDNYANYRCDYELWDCENGIFLYIGCNTESPVFSKLPVRSALTYAIDRDAIVEKYYRDFAHPATLPASPLSPYYNSALAAKYTYEPQKFIDALNDNYASGSTIRILVNKGDTLRQRIAREISKMIEACGLVVELVEASRSDYFYLLGIGEFDLYISQTRLSANMDLSAFFMPNGSIRYGGMSDPATYALCLEALANKGNYLNLHRMVMDDGRLCPVLFQTYSVHATRGLLTGLIPSRDNVFFYTLDKTMQSIRDYS